MARIAPVIWTDTPACGTGVQMSKVYPPPALRWLVWYGGQIIRFCESPDQAFAWYFLAQMKGVDIAAELQELADNLDAEQNAAVPFDELERKEEDEGSDNNSDV